MEDLKSKTLYILTTALLLAGTFYSLDSEARRSCGAGCQRSMGSCTVKPDLWAAVQNAASAGVRSNSCCRSEEYNNRLRSCGYRPARRSHHMTGNAVDLNVSPRACNARSLARYGFNNVCPHYHANHCHVQKCGTAGSYKRAQTETRQRGREIQRRNRQRARSQNVQYYYEQPTSYYYQQQSQPSWWPYVNESGAVQ